MEKKIDLYHLNYQELVALLADWGYSEYHVDLIWRGLYQDLFTDLSEFDLRADLKEKLAKAGDIFPLPIELETESNDLLTHKFLLQLDDGETIETVLMRHTAANGQGRATVCLSTQAGCAMGCVFCATGQMGFRRQLRTGEIVAQLMHIVRLLAEEEDQVRNIVLMGMGEPLHNYEAVVKAIEIFIHQKGLGIGGRHITLSTVGLPPMIRRFTDDRIPVHLAVSLHAATDEERSKLVPPNRRWPLAELMDACRYYTKKRKRRIFFEWALIAGENDTPEQANAVGKLLSGMNAHINLIPLNPTIGYGGEAADQEAVREFQKILREYQLPSTVRQRRGIDIAAGCGQLRAQAEK